MKIEHPEGLKCSKCETVIDSTHIVIFQNLEDGTWECFRCRFTKKLTHKDKQIIIEEQHPITKKQKRSLRKWYNKCLKPSRKQMTLYKTDLITMLKILNCNPKYPTLLYNFVGSE